VDLVFVALIALLFAFTSGLIGLCERV